MTLVHRFRHCDPAARRGWWRTVLRAGATGWLFLGLLTGCSSWSPSDLAFPQPLGWDAGAESAAKPDGVPEGVFRSNQASRSNRSSLVLGVDFVHVHLPNLDATFWASVDETALPPDLRQTYLANGLRLGILSGPADALTVQNRTDQTGLDPDVALLKGAGVMAGREKGRQSIPIRPGKRHELPLSPVLSDHQTVLVRDSAAVRGRTLQTPQFVLAIRASPASRTGRATMTLMPEVHHGQVRQHFVSSDTAVRIDAGRERWELPALQFDWTASEGQTLVIAPAWYRGDDAKAFGLGKQMLTDPDHFDPATNHLVALIRLEHIP